MINLRNMCHGTHTEPVCPVHGGRPVRAHSRRVAVPAADDAVAEAQAQLRDYGM